MTAADVDGSVNPRLNVLPMSQGSPAVLLYLPSVLREHALTGESAGLPVNLSIGYLTISVPCGVTSAAPTSIALDPGSATVARHTG